MILYAKNVKFGGIFLSDLVVNPFSVWNAERVLVIGITPFYYISSSDFRKRSAEESI